MFLWSKHAGPRWLQHHERNLIACAGKGLAIIDRPGRSRSLLEVACKSKRDARQLVENFGGCIETLPRDWLERIARRQKTKPLRVGKRLIINRKGTAGRDGFQTTGAIWKSPFLGERDESPSHLVIPAGAAFGTGKHITTAMCLRMLEEITRKMRPRWSALDLGSGSGILALAAKHFGAGRILGIDVDSIAISTARENARLNKIGHIDFRVGDVGLWRPKGKFDIIMANLFSELLVKILPRFKANLARGGQLILSGVLRTQERELNRALRLNKIDIMRVRRRGKWIAMLAKSAAALGRGG